MSDHAAVLSAICLGEGMVMLAPADGTPLTVAELLRGSTGGAECNVAGLAALDVDVNGRPALWRDRDRGPLRRLLAAADIVLVGEDEAWAALGAAGLDAVRHVVGPRPTVVLKSDSHVRVGPDGIDVPIGPIPPADPIETDQIAPADARDADLGTERRG